MSLGFSDILFSCRFLGYNQVGAFWYFIQTLLWTCIVVESLVAWHGKKPESVTDPSEILWVYEGECPLAKQGTSLSYVKPSNQLFRNFLMNI